MAAGTNDFRDAVVGPGNHLGGPSADELRLGGWLDKVEAHVRQVGQADCSRIARSAGMLPGWHAQERRAACLPSSRAAAGPAPGLALI